MQALPWWAMLVVSGWSLLGDVGRGGKVGLWVVEVRRKTRICVVRSASDTTTWFDRTAFLALTVANLVPGSGCFFLSPRLIHRWCCLVFERGWVIGMQPFFRNGGNFTAYFLTIGLIGQDTLLVPYTSETGTGAKSKPELIWKSGRTQKSASPTGLVGGVFRVNEKKRRCKWGRHRCAEGGVDVVSAMDEI